MKLIGSSALAAAAWYFSPKLSNKVAFDQAEPVDFARNAICILYPAEHPQLNEVTGIISFRQETFNEELKVVANVSGLNPNSLHGMILHSNGDLTQGLKSFGKSYDIPVKKSESSHFYKFSGDLGNLKTDERGNGYAAFTHPHLSLFGPLSILGRSCVVYDRENSREGNAGTGVAGGVIGLSKEFKNLPPA